MPVLPWFLLLAFAAAPQAPRLIVTVSPPLDPAGAPWIVQLFEESSEGRKPVDERPVGVDGAWSSSAARYGVFYRLRVTTKAGVGWYADDKPFEWDPERGPREVRLSSSAFRATPVPVASLSVSGFQEPLKVEGGWFTWDKVVDGWMSVYASVAGPGRFDQSPRRAVRVSGGWVDPGFITLEIRPTYVLKGRAVLPTGEPAAGARIRSLSSTFYENLRTPADGRFQMTVRGGGENACLLVVDRLKAARIVPVPASQSEQDVPVAVSPGTLSLEFTPRGERRIGALVANGCTLSLGSAVSVMKSTIRVSAGSYALCGLAYGELDDDAAIPPEACVSGVLPPGGTLQLRLNP
ncbi:MAG: hypothetical protein ABI768_09060 [Acidobacteriota bacterium]